MILTLERWGYTPYGTFGTLTTGDGWQCYTLEEVWRDNARGTAIPVGTYALKATVYHKHGINTYEVMNVPGRSRILIHTGNTAAKPDGQDDTEGCILVGKGLGSLQGNWAVINSKDAFLALMARIEDQPKHTLVISNIDAGVLR